MVATSVIKFVCREALLVATLYLNVLQGGVAGGHSVIKCVAGRC
jgi:hypothetical protein